MPALLIFLGGMARVVLAYRLVTIIAKVATRLLILGVLVAAFLLVLSGILATLQSLSGVVPDGIVEAYSWFVPSNFIACISAIATVQIMIWAWHWKKYAFDLVSGGVS